VNGLASRSHRRTIPLVGRRAELVLLEQTFDRVRESGHACLATVLGEPGIGKSRLVDEFLVQLPSEVRVLQGRSGEYEEDPAFAPIAEMLRRELGLDRDSPDEVFRERLEEVVAGCCDASEVEQTAARLGIALGLTEPAREGRRYRTAELRAGILSFLQGMVRNGGPVVMVFEDLHVARQALLDVLDQLLEGAADLPVMVVAVARDSLLEVRPTWGSHPDSVSLRLEPLPEDEATELARAAAESIDDVTAARIASNTGGNPFFIVETTGMMLDEHAEHTQGAPHSHLLPPTVQAVVASRIDHLPDDARELFRKASVFSMLTFEESDLALVSAAPDPAVLQTLEEAELLVRDADRPGEWRIRHEMLRDVAYESLPKRERVRLHVGIVDRMREAGTIDRHPQGVAWHLEQAAMASLDLNPQDRTLAERAVDALAHAGDVARWRIESRTAIDLYDRALAMAGDESAWSTREARILSTRGEAQYWLGRFDDAAASLSRALEVGTEDVWTVAHASRFLGDIELNVLARPDTAAVLFERAIEASMELDDPMAMSRTLLMAAWVPYWRGEYETTRSMFERALQLARESPEGDRWAEARALTSLTSVISPVGDEHEALELAREALELGRAMRDPFTIAVAQQSIANSCRRMLELEDAHRYAEQATRTFHDLGARWEEASAQSDRGAIRRLLGDLDGAEQDLRETIRISRELGERTLPTWTVDRLVLVLVMKGEFAKARAEVTEAIDSLDPDDPTFRDTFLTSDVLLLLLEGEADQARERAARLLEGAREDGQRNEVASTTWWLARLFGPELVGGEDVAEEARATLEKAGWVQFVREPDLVLEALGRAAEGA
jgi:tetratricopeptide (TPR) repeat protein